MLQPRQGWMDQCQWNELLQVKRFISSSVLLWPQFFLLEETLIRCFVQLKEYSKLIVKSTQDPDYEKNLDKLSWTTILLKVFVYQSRNSEIEDPKQLQNAFLLRMMTAAMTWWTMVNTARAMKTNQMRKSTCSVRKGRVSLLFLMSSIQGDHGSLALTLNIGPM